MSEILDKAGAFLKEKGLAAVDAITNASKKEFIGGYGILLIDNKESGKILPQSVKGNTNFNIVDDYPWTLTASSNRQLGGQSRVPYVELTEFEIDLTALWAQMRFWLLGKTPTNDEIGNPYEDLYHAQPTGAVFKFPYFGSYDHSIQPSWDKYKSPLDMGGAIGAIVGAYAQIGQLLGAAPGSIINQPQYFKGAGMASYPINFTLYNTIGTEQDIRNNMNFKRRLQMSTLHAQLTRVFISPPAIFEVLIPGIRYSPAAIISQLNVNNVGQMNLMTIPGDKPENISGKPENIPDAYNFEIIITELITESREILHSEYSSIGGARPHITAVTRTNGEGVTDKSAITPAIPPAASPTTNNKAKRVPLEIVKIG